MAQRERLLMDPGWKFHFADNELEKLTSDRGMMLMSTSPSQKGGPSFKVDDSKWRSVDLPHDFVVESNFVFEDTLPGMEKLGLSHARGFHPGNVAWYRKKFNVSRDDLGKRFYLFFDGVFRDSTVYLNQFHVGRHMSGYTSFYYDVTDTINYGGENLLAVRVDATSGEGWWYEGGGIYRHVWLVKTDPVHVAPWGTFVSSEVDLSSSSTGARVTARTTIANRTALPVSVRLVLKAMDPSGKEAGRQEASVTIPAWDHIETVQEIGIAKAALWSVEKPHLYKLVTVIEREGKPCDEVETVFGIRDARFDPDKGFLLNGKPVKLQGVCCHQDHAGVGTALPDRVQEFRIEKLKEMGCNAYRCSHHAPAPELLDACDRLGILVVDETRYWNTGSEGLAQLEALIRRDRNHPSVILWSAGNEEIHIHNTEYGLRMVSTVKQTVRRLDPTRKVTLAVCFWTPETDYYGVDKTPLVCPEWDVMGFNYSPLNWEPYHRKYPKQPIVATEATSGMRTRGCHESETGLCHLYGHGPKKENVPPDHPDAVVHWVTAAENDFVSGLFLWTGFDYRGEPNPYLKSGTGSQFGLMDTCGFPKDICYYFRSWWKKEPLLFLSPHWNWPDRLGKPIDIFCYGNCHEAELFLNGKSLGKKNMPRNRHLDWPGVAYEPGVLSAKGYDENGRVVAEFNNETTGAPHAVRVRPDRSEIKADGRDVSMIAVEIIDDRGRVVPTADNEVCFYLEGEGKIIGVGNGDPGSIEPDKAEHRRAFNGLCQVIVQSTGKPGAIALRAVASGLRSALCMIQTA